MEKKQPLYFPNKREIELKEYIQSELLLKYGLKPYSDELNHYVIKCVKSPGLIAAVDVDELVVYIDADVANALLDGSGDDDVDLYRQNEVSFLIRHEMLHSILEHARRAFIQVALSKNYDPFKLTKSQFDEVMSEKNKANFLARTYNAGKGIKTSNIAGDINNSKYYLPFDMDYCKTIGGLVLADYPNWQTMSFEELNKILEYEEKLLIIDAVPIVVGKFNDDGTFTPDHEEDSFFKRTTEVNPKHIIGIRLPRLRTKLRMPYDRAYNEIELCSEKGVAVESWIDADVSSDGGKAALTSSGYMDVMDMFYVQPILECYNMDLYESEDLTCFGKRITPIDSRHAVFNNYIFQSQFSDYSRDDKSYEYKNSALQFELQDWFKDMLQKYKQEWSKTHK